MPTKESDEVPVPDQDRLLFEREMAGVRPLRNRGTVLPTTTERVPSPSRPAARPQKSDAPVVVDEAKAVRLRAGGVSSETLRALAKGDFRVEATCNLHGYREDTARRRIDSFLKESRQANRHVVAVVCGRGLHSGPGGPVLRMASLQELSNRMSKGEVLAVASAPPRLGGEGAFLVLLRRERR